MDSDNSFPEKPDFGRTWKKNLTMVWIAQFFSQIGFAFGLPFAPFYMQEMGVTRGNIDFWVELFGAGTPLTMMLFAPVWGALADKYGRRKMLLRSYLGGVLVLGLMGVVHAPVYLILLRLVQGALCGSVSAAQTLVATHTPEEHSGFALGSLNSAVFSGALTGAFIGGFAAEYFGYRTAFLISGFLMLIPFLLVLFGVHEYFVPLLHSHRGFFSSITPKKRHLALALPLLFLMGTVMFARQFDSSFIPLFVQDINGGIDGASAWTGALQAFCGIAGVLSGFLLGYLADRHPPGVIAIYSALITAGFMFSLTFAHSMFFLFSARFAMIFASSGLDPALQIWLCRKTIPQTRGLIFGWAASARSFGWFMAPLAGGIVTKYLGIRWLFVVGPVFFILIMFLIMRVMRRFSDFREEET